MEPEERQARLEAVETVRRGFIGNIMWLSRPPAWRESAAYIEAAGFYENHDHGDRKTSACEVEHAVRLFETYTGRNRAIDEKADKFFQYAAALSAVPAIGGFPADLSLPLVLFWSMTGLTILQSIHLRSSVDRPTLVEVPGLCAADDDPSQLIASSYHAAMVGEVVINEWKSTWLSLCRNTFLLALLLLVIHVAICRV